MYTRVGIVIKIDFEHTSVVTIQFWGGGRVPSPESSTSLINSAKEFLSWLKEGPSPRSWGISRSKKHRPSWTRSAYSNTRWLKMNLFSQCKDLSLISYWQHESPIPNDGELHSDIYNQELKALTESGKDTWFTAPWLYAELVSTEFNSDYHPNISI